MPFSAYLQAKLLTLTFGQVSWTPPTSVYIGLTAQTAAGSTDANIVANEPAIGTNAYARVAWTNNATTWPSTSGSMPTVLASGIAAVFPTSTGAWSSGAAQVQFFICDSATGTSVGSNVNVLAWGALAQSQVFTGSGISYTLPAGTIAAALA